MGVCILGMGDCAPATTSVQNAINFISSTTFNTMASIKSSQTSSTTAKQDLTVKVGTDSAVLLACVQVAGAAGYNPATCSSLMSSNLTASGITQSAQIVQLTTADITSDLITSLQQQLTQQIDQKISQTTDAAADTLKTFASTFQNGKNTTTTNNVSSSNFVSANFTLSSVSTMVNDVNTTQGFSVLVQNANNSSAVNIAQTLYASATEKLLMSNSTTASLINTMNQSGSQGTTQYENGIADYINSIGNALKGLLTGAMMPLVIGAVVVAGIIGLVIVFNFLPKGGAKPAAAARPTVQPPTPQYQYPAQPPPFAGFADQAYAAYQQAAPLLRSVARR